MHIKRFLLIFVFGFQLTNAAAQERGLNKNKIPASIANYLKQNYPTAKGKDYYQKSEHDTLYYEVEFKLKSQVYNLKFSSDGILTETEREIEMEDLAAELKQLISGVLHDNFQKMKIKKILEVNPLGKKQYELYIKVTQSKKYKPGFYNVMFDSKGGLVSIKEEELHSIESVF